MDVSKFAIAKLNGSNYLLWATKMQALLQAKDLWKHVVGNEVSTTTTDPTGTISNDDAKEKSMVRAMLICCIEPEFVPVVAAEENPSKVWQLLAYSNKSRCTASVHIFRNRLLNMKMGQEMTAREFVNKICRIERELAFAGKVIDDNDKKYALLNGLCDEYAIKKAILQESCGTSFANMVSSLEITENEFKLNGKSYSGSYSSGSSF